LRRARWSGLSLLIAGIVASTCGIVALRHQATAAHEAREAGAPGEAVAPGKGVASGDADAAGEAGHEPEEEDNEERRAMLRFARVYPTGRLPPTAYADAERAMRRLKEAAGKPAPPGKPEPPQPPVSSWSPLGPSPLDVAPSGLTNVSLAAGRATALASPDDDPSTLYLGTAQGGVWKSTDGGASWAPKTDDQPSLAVGAIAIDPKNKSTIWVGTGEGHTGVISYFGRGLLRSDDGGETWSRPAGDRFTGVSIVRLIIAPVSGVMYLGTTYAAAGRGLCHSIDYQAPDQGLFRSADGGKTWQALIEGPITDVEADFSGPLPVLFAARYTDGIHRLVDGGGPPEKLDFPDKGGSPGTLGVQLAIAPSDPKVIYASASITDDGFYGSRGTVFRSLDGGGSWAEVPNAPDHCRAQCDYDNAITVAPDDPGTVYVGGALCSVWKLEGATGDAPTSTTVSQPSGNCKKPDTDWLSGHVHPDLHGLFVHPKSGELYAMSDGGLSWSPDGGKSWEHRNAGVATIQFYGGCLHPGDPKYLLGGTQDNGFTATRGDSQWKGFITGDGVSCTAHPDGTLLYSELGGLVLRGKMSKVKPAVSTNSLSAVFDPSCQIPGAAGCGEERATFAPVVADPAVPETVYIGTYRLWRSTKTGESGSWEAFTDDLTGGPGGLNCTSFGFGDHPAGDMLMAVAVSPGSAHIYTASGGGTVAASHDGGQSFALHAGGDLPKRLASAVAIDAASPETVWVSFSGFSSETPQAKGHVFRSTDGGKSFEGFEPGGIDIPANTIAAHPVAPGTAFVGTDLGVMATYDGGKTFSLAAPGLPNVATYHVLYDAAASRLVALTHGRSAWALRLPAALTVSPGKLTFKAKPGGPPPLPQSADIANIGHPGSLARPAASLTGPDAPWLSLPPELEPAAGAKTSPLAVTIDPAGLALGTYQASIAITDALSADTPAAQLDVELVITDKVDEPGGAAGASGASGAAGSSGLAGSAGNQAGQSGASGQAGAAGSQPGPPPTEAAPGGDEGGCGCQVPGGSTPAAPLAGGLLAAAALLGRKRRGRRAA
jgi:photosystem II stability/assembly factor-like uncharacterized protein